MDEGNLKIEQRIYPIGAFSEKEVVAVFTDALCAEDATVDEIMNEWRAKSRAFELAAPPNLDVQDSELLPISVKAETLERIESVLRSYRYYLPPTFDIALAPIQKLVTPQISISLDHARGILEEATGPIPDDENASLCLALAAPSSAIEAAYLGSTKSPPFQNSSSFMYQFSSEDLNIKFIPVPPLKPIREMNLATEGAPFPYEVKAIPLAVGLGLPIVHIIKVPTGTDPTTKAASSRLVIANGFHRILRLAQLGNTHVASLVQSMAYEDMPSPFIDGPKEKLFVAKPVTVSTLLDERFSRVFKWKKSRRVIRLQVTVSQESSFVA